MVRCWLMSDDVVDQRLECHRDPPAFVSLDQLAAVGVEYFHVPVAEEHHGLEQIAAKRGYNYRDECVISRDKTPDYGRRIRQFFEEHLHTDEEIRYIRAGAGYFDVRSPKEEWIRILSEPGDLLILPAGIFHRFSVTTGDFIHAVRLFKGEPVWTPYNRSDAHSEQMDVHREYLAKRTAAA